MTKTVESIRLTHEDIVNITENISRKLQQTLEKPINPEYMEYLLCKAIREIKDVNMYK